MAPRLSPAGIGTRCSGFDAALVVASARAGEARLEHVVPRERLESARELAI
jgi:hypothetical protein